MRLVSNKYVLNARNTYPYHALHCMHTSGPAIPVLVSAREFENAKVSTALTVQLLALQAVAHT